MSSTEPELENPGERFNEVFVGFFMNILVQTSSFRSTVLFLSNINERRMKLSPTSYMKCAIIDADKAIAETSQQTASRHVESSRQGAQASEGPENSKLVLRVNDEGRYVCQLCEKTFKTVCCLLRNNK